MDYQSNMYIKVHTRIHMYAHAHTRVHACTHTHTNRFTFKREFHWHSSVHVVISHDRQVDIYRPLRVGSNGYYSLEVPPILNNGTYSTYAHINHCNDTNTMHGGECGNKRKGSILKGGGGERGEEGEERGERRERRGKREGVERGRGEGGGENGFSEAF